MMIVLLVLLVLVIVGGLPNWGHHGYGWGPSSVGGILLVILVLWLLFGGGARHLHF